MESLVHAVVYCWYPGEAGGEAVAEILFGKENPSGKLPITVPRSIDQLPPFNNYSMTGRTYRYMDESPLYPFGFGLSYSVFSYSEADLKWDGLSGSASVNISNTGKREGMESIQLYIAPPGAGTSGLPKWSLKGVEKTSLKPGETKRITFLLEEKVLAFSDENGELKIFPGEYTVYLGGSSPDSRSIELGAAPLQKLIFIYSNCRPPDTV